MGVSFKKELVVDRVQVHPAGKQDDSITKLQVNNFNFISKMYIFNIYQSSKSFE